MRTYRERLRVPASWWLMPVAAATSAWLAYQHAFGPAVSVPVAGVVVAFVGGGLFAYGRATVAVDDDAFVAGRARLPLWAVGKVAALSAVEARAARGPDADPRVYLLVRGYVGPMVRVGVDDPDDPVPYWLVSTRHPQPLVAALEAARGAAKRAS
ncbi:MAG TPA: DUF3093 domain-containing protein [Jiangellaceae bacterium]|nr:DUF3093 domain-containing protein [Jiangellaceae bacterium]